MWIAVGLASWVAAGMALALLIGGMIRLADRRASSSDAILVVSEPSHDRGPAPRLLRSVS